VKNKGSVVGTDEHSDDVRAIQALIARQFASLSWSPGKPADWEAFAADFYPDAALYPAARPAKRQTVGAFVERMKGLAVTRLRSFKETVVGTEVHVFGNVAVALAACEITENDADVTRGVEALLLIKDAGRWQIVSQAWDAESDTKPIPVHLVREASG
jgi:ketosteroid isomerase-like protein